ncbi:TPA: hypothetical protein L4U31_002823 [Pseudomonas aeruginosa]|nr:hypothetical protein [Pseudomonas aeruginosa]
MNVRPFPRPSLLKEVPTTTAADSIPRHALPVCSVLTPELAESLKVVNAVSRSLRAAGVLIDSTVVLDRTIFIKPETAGRLASAFSDQWRGASWTTRGQFNKNMVTIDGVRVAWLTPAKEQGQ